MAATSALLEYVVTDEQVYLFVITGSAARYETLIHAYPLQINRDVLAKKVTAFASSSLIVTWASVPQQQTCMTCL